MILTKRLFMSTLASAALILAVILPVTRTSALSSSSLTVSDPRPSETGVVYTFDSSSFTNATSVRCVDILLNDASDGAGTAVGTTTAFTLDSSTAFTAGSWTADNSTNGRLRMTNAAGEAPAVSGDIVFGGITNGGTTGTTYYGIFTSYTDALCTGGNEVDAAVVAFIYKDGELVQLTIDPTLIFTCSGVASGQAVNGATTTVASGPAGIDHEDNVTFAANGISAHDIAVGTNATGGYTVSIRHTGLLSNGSDTITNHTGTNVAPTAFSAAGTESWGYTTEDGTLAAGTADRFTTAGGDLWSGFATSNELVIDNTSATPSVETTRVGHQVGVAASTPAGTYQTTVIYTVASVY